MMTLNRVTVRLTVRIMIGAVLREARAKVAHQARLIDHPIMTQTVILGQAGAEEPLKRQVNTRALSKRRNTSLRNS